jgi:hypothetical protein
MRYSFNFIPVRVLLLAMVAGITFGIGMVQSNAYQNGTAQRNSAVWSKKMNDAFARSDVVVLGTVTSVRNYTPTDGGYGYDIAVSDVLKGNAIARCSVRMGGWAYTIRFTPEQKVLLFLKQSDTFLPKEPFVLTLDANQKPLAFRVEKGRISGVDSNLQSVWEGRSIQEIKEILQNPK